MEHVGQKESDMSNLDSSVLRRRYEHKFGRGVRGEVENDVDIGALAVFVKTSALGVVAPVLSNIFYITRCDVKWEGNPHTNKQNE